MSSPVKLEYKAFPSVTRMYPKMLLAKKPSLIKSGDSYPRIEASIKNITLSKKHVNQFAKVSGFSQDIDALPLPYPHILAAPLHYSILNHKAFPLKLLGLVHISNSIKQHRKIGLNEAMDINCYIEDFDETAKGQIFHLQTVITIDDETVWEETCSFLARKKSNTKAKKSSKPRATNSSQNGNKTSSWEIPANMGRKFAKVSGDINPIHLSDISARLFGFKKAIIHGVWSMSRTMAELEPEVDQSRGVKLDVNFKLPVFLPAWVCLERIEKSDGVAFVMTDSAGEKPHLSGSVDYM